MRGIKVSLLAHPIFLKNNKILPLNSTLSSGLNSLAAVVWEDMVRPMSWSVTITEGRQVFLTRAIAAFMGLITVGLAVITANLDNDGILKLGSSAMGVLAGPLLAIFLLGFFTTAANKYVSSTWNQTVQTLPIEANF